LLAALSRIRAGGAHPYGRAARRTRLATVAAVALLAALSGIAALSLHRREIHDTQQRIALIATLLAEETSRAFKNVDLVLESLVDEADRQGVDTPEAFARTRAGREAHDMLSTKRLGLPQVDTLSFVDASGRMLATTGSFPNEAVDLSGRDYFKALSNAPGTASYVSEPTPSPGSRWSAYVARRVQSPEGAFLGLVLCGIDLDGYRRLYESLELGPGISVGLWKRDGTRLVRFPHTEREGRPGWLDEIGAGRSATYETASGHDGFAQVVAARATADMNLVVSVSAKRSQALAEWRLFTAALGLVTGGAIVALVLAGEALRSRYLALGQRDAALAEREGVVEGRERAEAQLRQSQKMDTVGQLAGGIAHDFNNMLAVVVGSLAVLRRRLDRGDPDVGRFVDAAVEGAERAAGLSRRLLAFSRQQDIEPVVLEVDAFLAQAAEVARRTVGRALRFEVALDAPDARVLVDPSQLENALLNLAINARDAMPGGGTLRVTSRTVPSPGTAGEKGWVELCVEDTGTGMPEEVLAQARSPFFTTKAEGEGTGLGLSQVAGFCQRSGGRMEIDSRPGEGTRVRLLLPATDDLAGSRVGDDGIPSAPESGAAVLVVDDEADVREVTVAMLRDLGYRVVDAGDRATAMGLATTMPDLALIVSDVVMPDGDGASLALDATRMVPGLRALLVSGLEERGPMGGIPILAKPYDLGQLARAVRDALDAGEGDRRVGIAA
jgi:signal transduction histidine kinase/CheY-like chemotaxis protein